MSRTAALACLVVVPCLVCAVPVESQHAGAHLMRYADVHGEWVVFTYEDDLWLVPSAGGEARRLTSHPGSERDAKFSPDGSLIAFTGSYDGGRDVYVMDARGGVPRRLTYHPSLDRVLGWHPSGDRVLFRSSREAPPRTSQVYTVAVNGGMPVKLPVDRAGLTCFSPDGTQIAYNRIVREERTWKRHQGGTAQDVWVGNLDRGDFHRITDWEGTDNFPMWDGDAIYFTSDRHAGTLNLFRFDVGSGETRALTSFDDYDVKYPSIGPGKIVYQYAESLYLFDLSEERSEKVEVRLASDRVPVRPEYVEVARGTGSFRLSPSGDRVLLEARGEILSVPVEGSEWKNLTRSSRSRETRAVWSPDGSHVALISDRSGEDELWLVDPEGGGEWRQLTRGGAPGLAPVWSPDSRSLLFTDRTMRLILVDAEGGTSSVIDRSDQDDGWQRWGIQDYVWSPDSRWIAYTKMEPSLTESIFLYQVDSRVATRLTARDTTDWSPSFDPRGRYLYFLSRRTFRPRMGQVDQNHVFLDMTMPYVVILRDGEPSPFAPGKGEQAKAEEPTADSDEPLEVVIDLDGIGDRIVAAEDVGPGDYFRLEATRFGFLYISKTEPEFSKYNYVTDDTEGHHHELHAYSFDETSANRVMEGIANYHLSSDLSKLVYRAGQRLGVIDLAVQAKNGPGKDKGRSLEAKVGDGEVDLAQVRIKVDRLQEFAQIFDEAWRIQRDSFYDPGMHGVDWQAIGDKYRRFVPFCGNRSDLNYLIGEMIGELNIGHTYVFGGDGNGAAGGVGVGLLGADLEQPEGSAYHRITHILTGTSWNPDERSPLREPGCGVREGDYLIAIDGEEIHATDNVYALLEGRVDKTVTVNFNRAPEAEGADTCRVTPIRSERAIRYREWVENNRARVEEASGGAIGYLHLPDMGEDGLIEFARVFYPQHQRRAFIIDERYNAGGFVCDMIIDRLERRLWSLVQPRDGKPMHNPERAFHGHLAVLINQDTGSDGENFAEAIKRKGLAKVIGMRTWGGVVGIEMRQALVDGGVTTPPQFAPFGLDGEWIVEGRGVEPDIEVENMPGDVVGGFDAQLDTAIRYLMEKLDKEPMTLPERPPFPDKSKPVR